MLNKIHFTHLGENKYLNRQCLFWPGMSNDIKNIIKQCTACRTFKNTQCKQPIKFYFDNHNYLLLIDYYSKYVEISLLQNLSSNELIKQCKRIFSRLGIPECVVSDNGTNFSSQEF